MRRKQTVIIFEGPDFTGKTEISKALSSRLDIPVYKNKMEGMFVTSDDSTMAAYCSFYVADLLEKTGISVILDRFHISEWVYAKIFNRRTNGNFIIRAENILSTIGAVVIYCYKTNYAGYEDRHIKIEQIKYIEQEYKYYFTNYLECKIFTLNTFRVCSLEVQVDSICRWLQKKEYPIKIKL